MNWRKIYLTVWCLVVSIPFAFYFYDMARVERVKGCLPENYPCGSTFPTFTVVGVVFAMSLFLALWLIQKPEKK